MSCLTDHYSSFTMTVTPNFFPGSICCCSVTQPCLTLCNPMDCSIPGFPVLHHLLDLVQTHVYWVVMSSDHLVFCHSFLPCLQSFPASGSSNESTLCIRWPKCWSFSISPSNEYSGLISFSIDWFNIFAVQGTLKSLQHHSSKALIYFHQITNIFPGLWHKS